MTIRRFYEKIKRKELNLTNKKTIKMLQTRLISRNHFRKRNNNDKNINNHQQKCLTRAWFKIATVLTKLGTNCDETIII